MTWSWQAGALIAGRADGEAARPSFRRLRALRQAMALTQEAQNHPSEQLSKIVVHARGCAITTTSLYRCQAEGADAVQIGASARRRVLAGGVLPFPPRGLSARGRPRRGRPAGAAARPGGARPLARPPARAGWQQRGKGSSCVGARRGRRGGGGAGGGWPEAVVVVVWAGCSVGRG